MGKAALKAGPGRQRAALGAQATVIPAPDELCCELARPLLEGSAGSYMRLRPGASRSSFEPQLLQLHPDAWMSSGSLSVVTLACEVEAVSELFLPIRQVPSTGPSV